MDIYDTLKTRLHTDAPGTVVLTAIAFICLVGLIWSLTSRVPGAKDNLNIVSSNRLACVLGALCGWAVGLMLSPFGSSEQGQFDKISGTAAAFLSGYVVNKVDRYLEQTLFPISKENASNWIRVGFFSACFLLAGLTVFLNRLYAFRDDPRNTPVAQPNHAIVSPRAGL